MPSTPCSQIVRACTPNERLGVLGHCKCLPGLMSLMVYGIGSSSPRPPSLQCFANSSAGPIPFSRWAHGVVVSHPPHAEGPGFKSQCVHFVIHMPGSTKVARELRARIPAALSCTSPLTQSRQPNVWHSDLVQVVAQALARTILECMVWMNLISRTLWPSGLRRWLKAPFRKGVGSNPTGVISFGLILRHDVLHIWSGPYIQRAPATLGPCRCFANAALRRPRPACKCQPQQRSNQVVRSPKAA
jgi:hypothetical protein